RIKDSILISYTLENTDNKPHDIGVRIMLDTKLGSNDGAPFRIGTRSITSEEKFGAASLFDYWQAFDALTSPNVIAQGSIRLLDEGIKPPDSMYLVNWGTLVDFPWDFEYKMGRSFIRAGETEKDTSLALYWNAKSLGAKQKRTHRTLYGLGGITLAPGELSLGLTAPAEIYSTSKKEILVMGYILNTGGFDSKNTVATFILPPEFKLMSGQNQYSLGLLRPGEEKQIPIKLKLKNKKPGKKRIGLKISSETLEKNEIYREIEVLSPPVVTGSLRVPKKQLVKYNYFIDATLKLKNKTKHKIGKLTASIDLDKNLELPFFEIKKKEILNLYPGKEVNINWKLKIKDPGNVKNNISAKVSSALFAQKKFTAYTKLSKPQQKIELINSKETIKAGDYFYLELNVNNPRVFKNLDLSVSYNNNMLKFNRISYSSWLIKSTQTGKVTQEPNLVMVSGLNNQDKNYEQKIIKIHFQAIKEGSADFILKKDGEIIKIKTINIKEKE
ncbi:cohesin domain-containing protein, partial [Candidatus Margulisiibacteriota bacterium]